MSQKRPGLTPIVGATLFVFCVLGALVIAQSALAEGAGPAQLRPTLAPLIPTTQVAPVAARSPELGHIILKAPASAAGMFGKVQWFGAGQWFDVDGWRGTVPESATVRWTVYRRDYGTGPFRWVIVDAADKPVFVSPAFRLPCCDGIVVTSEALPISTPR